MESPELHASAARPSSGIAAGVGRGQRVASGLNLSAASAPAALLAMWSVLLFVFSTTPIRPYADGDWLTGDLSVFLLLGAIVGLVGRGLWGLAGIVLGTAGAIALQLFVLTGQASWVPTVVATMEHPAWSSAVAASLAAALGTLATGYGATRAVIGVARAFERKPGDRIRWSGSRPSGALIPVGMALGGIAIAAILVLDASTSAYVQPPQQPPLDVVMRGDSIASIEPTTMATGRIRVNVVQLRATDAGLYATGRLRPEQEAAIGAGRIGSRVIAETLVPGTRPGGQANLSPEPGATSRLMVFPVPGNYAIVVSRGFTTKAPAGGSSVPILDARIIVVREASRTGARARGDAGVVQMTGGLFGIAIAGWAAAGTIVVARRPRRSRRLAPAVGIAMAALLWLLATLAIDVAHNPF